MPFAPPWADYRKGDLLYGLSNERAGLAQHLGVKAGDVHTIDEYALVANEVAPWDPTSPLKYDQGFINSLNVHNKNRLVVGRALNSLPDAPTFLAHAKRKCKGGLNYIISNTQHHIHFCLDGLETTMEDVPGKSFKGIAGIVAPDTPVGKADASYTWLTKTRSITGAELRWVYRNRMRNDVQQKVQFWLNNAPCYPPWGKGHPDSWIKAWAAYSPTNLVWL